MQRDLEKALDTFARLVRHFVRQTDFHALYPATVIRQSPGLGVEVKPDDPRVLPHDVLIPIRTLPGLEVAVTSGARCLIGFEGGNPSRPYATSFERLGAAGGGFTELRFDGGSSPVARVGDTIDGGVLLVVSSGGVVTAITFLSPLTLPAIGPARDAAVSAAIAALGLAGGATAARIDLVGRVLTGAARTKA